MVAGWMVTKVFEYGCLSYILTFHFFSCFDTTILCSFINHIVMSDADSSRKRPLEEDSEPKADHNSTLNDKEPSAKKARSDEMSAASHTDAQQGGANPPQPSSSPQAASQSQQPPRPQTQQQPAPPPRRDHAFFGTDVLDDVVRAVGEFLFQHCHHPNVEVTSKRRGVT